MSPKRMVVVAPAKDVTWQGACGAAVIASTPQVTTLIIASSAPDTAPTAVRLD